MSLVAADNISVAAINAMVADLFPGSPNRCVQIDDRFAVAACDVTPASIRPGGFISGPVQFGLADAALWFMSFAALERIEPMALTSELSIRFLRPAQGDRLMCRADLEARSRRSVVGNCRVWVDGAPDRITAIAQGTYAIPLPR